MSSIGKDCDEGKCFFHILNVQWKKIGHSNLNKNSRTLEQAICSLREKMRGTKVQRERGGGDSIIVSGVVLGLFRTPRGCLGLLGALKAY